VASLTRHLTPSSTYGTLIRFGPRPFVDFVFMIVLHSSQRRAISRQSVERHSLHNMQNLLVTGDGSAPSPATGQNGDGLDVICPRTASRTSASLCEPYF
jgi:hypothetical protein